MRLISFFAWIGLVMGVVWIIGGLSSLAGPSESQATVVEIASLESCQDPDANWLDIRGGYIYWPKTLQLVERLTTERLSDAGVDAGLSIDESYFVPVVSPSHLGSVARSDADAFRGCRVLAYFSKDTLEWLYPDVLRGKPEKMLEQTRIKGVAQPATKLDREVQERLEQRYAGLDTGRTIVVSHGIKPLSKKHASYIAMMGFGLALPCWLWIRWRRRRRRALKNQAAGVVNEGAASPEPAGTAV